MVTLQGLLTRWEQKGTFWGARNVLCLYLVVVLWLRLLCKMSLHCALKTHALYYIYVLMSQ